MVNACIGWTDTQEIWYNAYMHPEDDDIPPDDILPLEVSEWEEENSVDREVSLDPGAVDEVFADPNFHKALEETLGGVAFDKAQKKKAEAHYEKQAGQGGEGTPGTTFKPTVEFFDPETRSWKRREND